MSYEWKKKVIPNSVRMSVSVCVDSHLQEEISLICDERTLFLTSAHAWEQLKRYSQNTAKLIKDTTTFLLDLGVLDDKNVLSLLDRLPPRK